MKKLLLISLALLIGAAGFAQKGTVKRSNLSKISVKVKNQRAITGFENVVEPLKKTSSYVANKDIRANLGTQIGTTTYDLQTNSSSDPHRIICYPDGTISAIWTYSISATLAAPDRGTGYNYFDGTVWDTLPTARIEGANRTGWPSIAPLSGGIEYAISHQATAGISFITYSSPKGGTAWATSNSPTPLVAPIMWPRLASDGNQTLHMIGLVEPPANGGDYFHGMAGALIYSKSTDAGVTWSDFVVPTGMDSIDGYIGFSGDSYAIDCKGDTVVIASFGEWYDTFIVKSVDGGNTWTKKMIWQFPIPNYDWLNDTQLSDTNADGLADTITNSDGTGAVILDKNGKAHVFFGRMSIINDSIGDGTSSYFPYTDGLIYWNEDMLSIDQGGGVLCASMVDVNGNDSIDLNSTATNGGMGTYFTSLSSFPNAGYDVDNNIYCIYSSVTELTDYGDGRAYRNIYGIKHLNGANDTVWSAPSNITDDMYSESVFPSMYKKIDSKLHFIFQNDYQPGLCVRPSTSNPNTEFGVNDIRYLDYDKDAFNTGQGIAENNNNVFNVSQNYPNPFNGYTAIEISISKSTDLSVSVSNMMGQKVSEMNLGKANAGNHTLYINGSNLTSGIYFYTVKAGEQTITKKMIVE